MVQALFSKRFLASGVATLSRQWSFCQSSYFPFSEKHSSLRPFISDALQVMLAQNELIVTGRYTHLIPLNTEFYQYSTVYS